MEKDQNKQGGGGGTAEHQEKSRSEQQHQGSSLSTEQKEKLHSQTSGDGRIGDLEETGQMSGRDDYAGGFGERMEDQDTGQPTER